MRLVEAFHNKGVSEMTFPSDQSSFEAMLAHSGMDVPAEQLPSLFEGYQYLLRMIDLLERPTTREAEPATTFAPEKR
jgi:hypothetical protein